MVYEGNDIYEEHYEGCAITPQWPWKNASAGFPFFTVKGRKYLNKYTGKAPIYEFPAVPYCGEEIFFQSNVDTNYFSGLISSGKMHDINTKNEYVQQRIADFLTELMSIGITGFSIHNGKYITSVDYVEIFYKLKKNLGGGNFTINFATILEMDFVIYNQRDLICNENNDENFSNKFEEKLLAKFGNQEDVDQIKIQTEDYNDDNYKPHCNGKWMVAPERFILTYGNQNNQYKNSKF